MQGTSRTRTLADAFAAASETKDILLVLGASLALGLLAQVKIPLPATPVPITLQTLGVFLIAAILGSRRAAVAMSVYLAEGAAGLPVFAGGASGVLHLFGPTGGYLLSYVPAAFVIGFLAERGWDRTPVRAFVAMFLGSWIIYAMGLLVLSLFLPKNLLLESGLWPFLPGAFVKMIAASLLLPSAWGLIRRSGLSPRP